MTALPLMLAWASTAVRYHANTGHYLDIIRGEGGSEAPLSAGLSAGTADGCSVSSMPAF